jgi:RNA polymerase sigma-70 factor (ECF subfamily)
VIADPGADPEQATIRNLTRERLLSAVRRLPEGARQVVILNLSGLGAAEIGEVLGITENNAAVRLSRARRALKDLL